MKIPGKWHYPYGAWIMPFGSAKVPEVKVESPISCPRCKGYMNPCFQVFATNNNVSCNLCQTKFTIPTETSDILLNPTIASKGVVDLIVDDKKYHRKR